MFDNKEDFKKCFSEEVIKTYGREMGRCHISQLYLTLGQMVRNYASIDWKKTVTAVHKHQSKQVYYFSMEFLIGRLLLNNLMNLGIYEIVRDGLDDLGVKLSDLEEVEADAGLGNGGLGRLAACFLDSAASLALPVHGNTIRYEYGLFKQLIEDNKQKEVPDIWLKYGYPWEVRRAEHAVEVKFYGEVQTYWNYSGNMDVKHVNAQIIRAVPYDVPIIGYHNEIVNTLRLWKPEASENANAADFISYIQDVNKICQNVYPDDSTEEGRMLRIKQEYFFVSAGIQTILASHYKRYKTFDNLADKVTIQLNDTHPILIIPELMRILLDEYQYKWDDAWKIVCNTVAYTNHTIMQEALEKWPIHMIDRLLPRISLLIKEIDARFRGEVMNRTGDGELSYRVAIIRDNMVHMSHLADATVFSINGVAKIHTEILKNDVMKDFYRLFPEKFNNKTNGITHRRWLINSNPELTKLLEETIGDGFISNINELDQLNKFVDDEKVQKKFKEVKRARKVILADYVKRTLNIEVDPDSIFDVQAKRLHAYKRQMLNCMNIIYRVQQIRKNPNYDAVPVTYFFSAKAAPAYTFAKKVIELINCLAETINDDPQLNRFIKVVFVPNYSVSVAEILLNAADVSEQISTAGKEASGTGNMKLMMNGAITLGTLDGANVEIRNAVGKDNFVLFGKTVEELAKLKLSYNATDIYHEDETIRNIMNSLIDGSWSNGNADQFRPIFDEILYRNDEFFLLADFHEYVKAQEKINELYRDSKAFTHMALKNVANSAFFSSDRTIKEYNEDIWHLKEIEL